MSDAPFRRSNSDDEIFDESDEDMALKSNCCAGRTALECFLFVIATLLIGVIVGLAVGLTRPLVISRQEHCQTSECVHAAASLMGSMDKDADPCADFFQYACGAWVRSNPVPSGYSRWDRVQELAGQNHYVLRGLLESQLSSNSDAESKARYFYKSCMDHVSISGRQSVVDQLMDVVNDVGGWSHSSFPHADSWYFVTSLQQIHRHGVWPLFKVTVDVDEREPTRHYILKIDLGNTVFPPDMYPFPSTSDQADDSSASKVKVDKTFKSTSSEDHSASSHNISTSNQTEPSTDTTKPSEKFDQASHRVKRLFIEETTHILEAFGFNSSLIQKRVKQMAELEYNLVLASDIKDHVHDRFLRYNVLTVEQLEANFSMFSWTQYFNTLGFKVKPEHETVVFHPKYLARLTRLVKSILQSPEQSRVLRDYMMLILVRSFQQYFDFSLLDLRTSESDTMQENWKRCTFYTNKALGFATGAMFVRETGQESHIDEIQGLISYVRTAFKEFILRKFWIDEKTRLRAEKKVDNIINKISYPAFIMNASILDIYYKEFDVKSDNWIQNLLNWRKFDLLLQNKELLSLPDRQKSWIRPPVTVNALYSPIRNDVIFPIAMFHLPYYIPNGPIAVNFGAMGSIIGHEITHAFDFEGQQYDEEGRLRKWWDSNSSKNFGVTTQCMVEQYNKIQVKGQQVDGELTLDENIADNGGMRAAYYAFMKWMENNGSEAPLPGLNLTHHQVFFLSYAQMYCSKWTETGVRFHLLTDTHSPGVARVNGVLANSKPFSWAFNCPMYSPMNAQTKCEVW